LSKLGQDFLLILEKTFYVLDKAHVDEICSFRVL